MAENQGFGLEPTPRLEANSDRVQEKAITSEHQGRSLTTIRSQAMQNEVFGRDIYCMDRRFSDISTRNCLIRLPCNGCLLVYPCT
jgi:hypothetical protein